MLTIEAVTKRYHNGTEDIYALNSVSLEIKPADYLAIVGPSGSGKSTLLHIMGGLDSPTNGKVLFYNKDIYEMKDDRLALWRGSHIGFVFQFYHLIEELNVLENITVGALKSPTKLSFKKAEELLKYFNIYERRDSFPSQLSGGEKQRTAIARALFNEPQVILCDEPTGSLDKDSQEKVISFLENLNLQMGKTVIIVTHNLELAKRAKRIVRLRAGEIIKEN